VVFAGLGDTRYGFFATHNVPLKLLPSVEGHSKRVSILGVQPGCLEVGEEISPEVRASAEDVVREVESQLRERDS
jgi:Ni,Fe-hydrogenase maturation factor